MKTIKLIDLLNKIANGEEVPKKFKIETHIFTKYYYPMGDGTFVSSYESNNDGKYYINDFLYPQDLNNEIEILEEDTPTQNQRIERLKLLGEMNLPRVFFKVNEIIDCLNSKGE